LKQLKLNRSKIKILILFLKHEIRLLGH